MPNKKTNLSKISKTTAYVAISAFIINLVILLTVLIPYLITAADSNSVFTKTQIPIVLWAFYASIFVTPILCIIGIICMIIGARNKRKYKNRYSALAYWFGLVSTIALVPSLVYSALVVFVFSQI